MTTQSIEEEFESIRIRQERIHLEILQRGEVRAAETASKFGISLSTIRRDLVSLERRGLIERVWGGAQVRSPIKYLSDFYCAAAKNGQEKRAIAARAASCVEEGMVIGLSGGTTCTELARWLRGRRITVVTNALNVATELYNHSLTKVVVTGGALNSYSYELVGEMVAHSLTEYRLDLSFVGCSGITPDFGVSMRDTPEAAGARAFISVSEKTKVIADYTKAGKWTLARLAPLAAFDELITDDKLSDEWRERLNTAGLQVFIAKNL